MKALCIPATRQQATPIPATFAKLARQKALQVCCRIKRSIRLTYSKQSVGSTVLKTTKHPAQLIENKRSKWNLPISY